MSRPVVTQTGTRLAAFRGIAFDNQISVQRHDGRRWRNVFRGTLEEWAAFANAGDDARDKLETQRAGGPTR